MDLRNYIEERSVPEPNTGCWIWLAAIGTHGYGSAAVGGKITTAHRVAHEAFNGPVPPGMLVQHSCDNRWCVAPHHLSAGTDRTNSDDKHRKGRSGLDGRRFGPHPNRRLSDEAVRDIRASALSTLALAVKHGVTWNTVHKVRTGVYYSDVTQIG